MQKKLISFLITIFTIGIMLFPIFAHAQYGLNITGQTAGYNMSAERATPYYWVGKVINTILALTGFVCFGFLLYAGLRWMTARGNEELATKAKETIETVIIGLVIVVSAYAISSFILGKLLAPGTVAPGSETNPNCDTNFTCDNINFKTAYCSIGGSKLCCSDSALATCLQDGTETDVTCKDEYNVCKPYSTIGVFDSVGGIAGANCTNDSNCGTGLVCESGLCTVIPSSPQRDEYVLTSSGISCCDVGITYDCIDKIDVMIDPLGSYYSTEYNKCMAKYNCVVGLCP